MVQHKHYCEVIGIISNLENTASMVIQEHYWIAPSLFSGKYWMRLSGDMTSDPNNFALSLFLKMLHNTKIANRIWPSWKQLSRDLIHFISSKTIKWNIYIYKVKFVLWHRHLVLNLSLSNRQRVTNQSWASTSMASPSRASQSVGHMSITTRREGSRSRQYSPQNGIWLVNNYPKGG